MSQNVLASPGNMCVFKTHCQFASARVKSVKPPSVSESDRKCCIFFRAERQRARAKGIKDKLN